MNSGHYVTFARHESGAWYCFNDATVTEVPVSKIASAEAYMLLYERRAPPNRDEVLSFIDGTLLKSPPPQQVRCFLTPRHASLVMCHRSCPSCVRALTTSSSSPPYIPSQQVRRILAACRRHRSCPTRARAH